MNSRLPLCEADTARLLFGSSIEITCFSDLDRPIKKLFFHQNCRYLTPKYFVSLSVREATVEIILADKSGTKCMCYNCEKYTYLLIKVLKMMGLSASFRLWSIIRKVNMHREIDLGVFRKRALPSSSQALRLRFPPQGSWQSEVLVEDLDHLPY